MRLATETVTVINAHLDPAEALDTYHATVISGVSWYATVATAVSDDGLKGADKYTIRIPVDADFGGKTFVEPSKYDAASPNESFTLRPGDHIVRGAVDGDVSPSALQKRQYRVVTILGVTDDRRAPNAKHWKVVGA